MVYTEEIQYTRNYSLFIKTGSRVHMEALHLKGHLHCKTFGYFRTRDRKKDRRGDPHDGVSWIEQGYDFKLHAEDTLLGQSDTAQINIFDDKNDGNIFCMCGIETPEFNSIENVPKDLKISSAKLKWDEKTDTATLITNFFEFEKRVNIAASKINRSYDWKPLLYYDRLTEHGEITPFMKSDEYQHEGEVRFWFPSSVNKDLDLFIGDLTDISILIPLEELDKICYHSDHNKT